MDTVLNLLAIAEDYNLELLREDDLERDQSLDQDIFCWMNSAKLLQNVEAKVSSDYLGIFGYKMTMEAELSHSESLQTR
jgi:hypothetical protein